MAWKKGPLPKGTWGWGAIVPTSFKEANGFYFADFQGDKVKAIGNNKVYKADEIMWYDNSIELPPPKEE